MRWTSRCALLGVGAMMIAGDVVAQNGTNGKNGNGKNGSGIPVRKGYEPPPPPPPPVVVSRTTIAPGTKTVVPPDWNIPFTQFHLGAYNGTHEQNIAAHLATVDTLQLYLAALGDKRLTDPAARQFMKTMASDHSAHLAELTEIITDEGVGASPYGQDPEVERLYQALKKFQMMPAGSAFDASFMKFLIDHFDNELSLLSHVRESAHDDDFEKFIDEWRERLQTRRNESVGIATNIR
jgi:predicted outer membrane protein